MEGEKEYRRDLGQRGEDLACAELVRMGHLILERNCRIGHFEVDIISYDPAGIHFVEVKTRRMSIQAPPQENVDASKQRKLVKAALGYLNRKGKDLPGKSSECFFDVMAVTFDGDTPSLEWFPEAFIPIYV